jgi:diketogulonate reductase-like aldo/keto reductase
MVRKTFGWTGVEVPVIGQGTWMIEGSREEELQAVASLRVGLDLGMTHIDTAEMYGDGRAEELVGEAVTGRRQEVFLVSKVLPSNASYEGTLRACERSLKRLKTDYLDLYLLHWRGRYPLDETMRAMEALVAAGKIRFLGVSNFDTEDVMAAQRALTKERLAANQVLYHLGDRGIERRLIPYCAEQGIAVVGYSPFAHSHSAAPGRDCEKIGGHACVALNVKEFPQPARSVPDFFHSPGREGGKALSEIAARTGRTPRQLALNFLTRHSCVFAIPKASQPDHTRENSEGCGWPLASGDEAMIDRACPKPSRDTPLGML